VQWRLVVSQQGEIHSMSVPLVWHRLSLASEMSSRVQACNRYAEPLIGGTEGCKLIVWFILYEPYLRARARPSLCV
jgi:hypothetical protein